MIPRYIQVHYIDLQYGWSLIWTGVVYLSMAVCLLNNMPLSVRSVLLRLRDIALIWILRNVLSCVLYTFPNTTFAAIFPEMLVTALYAAFCSRLRTATKIVYGCSYISFYVLLLGISREFGVALKAWTGYSIGSVLLIVPGLVLAVLFLQKFSVEKFAYVPTAGIFLMVGISVLGALSQLYTMVVIDANGMTDESFHSYNLLVGISFLLLLVLAYYMFYIVSREYGEKTELLALKHRDEMDADVLAAAHKTYVDLREVRHEIKNHDAYMRALLEAKQYDQLKAYFDENALKNAEILRYVASGNDAVDAAVNYKMTMAKVNGVTVETMLAVPPKLPFEQQDICSLLSNLLDNAIEACAECDKQKKITLSIRPNQEYLFIRVTNPANIGKASARRRLTLTTTKPDRDLHGYGTRIIRSIAEKYAGCAKFSMEGDQFIADVMLSMHTGPEEQNA